MFRILPAFAGILVALSIGAPSRAGAQVTDVQVAPPSVLVSVGQRTSVFATAYDSKGGVVTTTRITWTTSNAAVVRVEADSTSPEVATLVGQGPGAAVVEARVGNRRGVVTVQVGGSAPVSAPAAVAAAPGAGAAAPIPVPAASQLGSAALLKLEPSSLFLLPGEAVKLAPVFLKDDGTPANPVRLSWKTMVPTVANVDVDGGVVGISPGQGLIEAAAGPLAARVPVSVGFSKIAITRQLKTMTPGTADTFTVIVPEQNNRSLPSNAIQWRSSDESVARVSPLGVVSAVAGGRAEIVALGFLQEIRVPVSVHKQVELLKLSPPARGDTIRIPLGSVQRFVAEPQAGDGTPIPEAPLTWRLLDSSVVGFDANSGVMTPRRVGTTRLRINVVGGTLDTAWTVSVVAGGVRAGTHLAGLGSGQSLKVSVALTDDAGRAVGPATGLRWFTSAPAVAQVDGDGNISAVGFGRASIVAASPWGKSDTVTVLVQGELLVTSTRGGTPDLYALDRKAPGNFNRLTNFPSNEMAASFAPGGASILFVSSKDGNQEIYAIDADGTNQRRLTNTPAQEDSPEWTPDGRQIVYASNASGTYQIWVMNADGTDQKRLTEGPAFNFQPAISPDGRTIAFTTTRESNYDIYLMNLDGSNQRSVLKNPGKETIPQWFPDGQLAFLQEQRTAGKNQPLASVVVRRDPGTGQLVSLSPPSLAVTDFAVSAQGDLLALIVSSSRQGGNMSSRLYLSSSAPGSTPTEVPLQSPGEQVFSPAFRR